MDDYKELIERLRDLKKATLDGWTIERLQAVMRTDCLDAADAIEQLVKERDAAVAAVHKQCSTCKRVDFCATDAGQPTLWACVSAAKCNWEWRGVQEDNDEID